MCHTVLCDCGNDLAAIQRGSTHRYPSLSASSAVYLKNKQQAAIIAISFHTFYSSVKGWTSACKLRAGDILVTVNGEYVVVEKVQHEILEAPVTVYNFQVEEYHTYYVSDAGVLAHNLCKQQKVAGQNDGYNAKVSVGGETNHPNSPHAHIYWKYKKLASVDETGNIMAGTLDKRGRSFVRNNITQIAKGINLWWYYDK